MDITGSNIAQLERWNEIIFITLDSLHLLTALFVKLLDLRAVKDERGRALALILEAAFNRPHTLSVRHGFNDGRAERR
jgi:hypothetical protein